MAEQDLARRKEMLEAHFTAFWAKNEARVIETLGASKKDLERWKALQALLLEDERFLSIAEPVRDDHVYRTAQYYMRYDGVLVFPEAVLRDEHDRLLLDGNPMRLPWDAEASVTHPYRAQVTESIFGLPMRSITCVLNDEGQRDHDCQMEEMRNIGLNQGGSRYPIGPFTDAMPLSQSVSFRPENLVCTFPVRRALDYMVDVRRFEPAYKGVRWLVDEASAFAKCPSPPFTVDDLGVTGSMSFGDEADLEDFDVYFLGPIERLVAIRDFIYELPRTGAFRPVTCPYKRRLRVCHRSLRVDETGAELIFCPFLGIDPPDADPLYGMRIEVLGRVDYFEALVLDGRYNMVSPPRVRVGELSKVRGQIPPGLSEAEIIVMHGAFRGQYVKGNWIRVSEALLVRIHPRQGPPREAFLSVGWYDIDLASW